jgi:hypothetical protein
MTVKLNRQTTGGSPGLYSTGGITTSALLVCAVTNTSGCLPTVPTSRVSVAVSVRVRGNRLVILP